MACPACWRRTLPLLAGPLAFAAFFLPWTHGPGYFAGETYSGFELVRVTGVLRGLDLPAAQGGSLVALRLLVLGVPIAASWLTVLSPAHRWHWAYPVAAAYLIAATIGLGIGRLLVTGDAVPSPGLGLLALASGALAVAHAPAASRAAGLLSSILMLFRIRSLQESHRRTRAA